MLLTTIVNLCVKIKKFDKVLSPLFLLFLWILCFFQIVLSSLLICTYYFFSRLVINALHKAMNNEMPPLPNLKNRSYFLAKKNNLKHLDIMIAFNTIFQILFTGLYSLPSGFSGNNYLFFYFFWILQSYMKSLE